MAISHINHIRGAPLDGCKTHLTSNLVKHKGYRDETLRPLWCLFASLMSYFCNSFPETLDVPSFSAA